MANINKQFFSLDKLDQAKAGTIITEDVLVGEVEGVETQLVLIKGPFALIEPGNEEVFDVLLSLKGKGTVTVEEKEIQINGEYIIRVPYGKSYQISVAGGDELYLLRTRKQLDEKDKTVISEDMGSYIAEYAKSFAECATYSEDIKSAKTTNRMLLDEGLVPRFCMGTVETAGPDKVDFHDHPMLDQLFLGLKGCRCKCVADRAEEVLTENTLLHVPLGSNHAVEAADGDMMYYAWLDFFLALEDQEYISRQHKIDREEK